MDNTWPSVAQLLDRSLEHLAKGAGGAVHLSGPAGIWRDLLAERTQREDVVVLAFHAEANDAPQHHILKLWAALTFALRQADEGLVEALEARAKAQSDDAGLQAFVEHVKEERQRGGSEVQVAVPKGHQLLELLRLLHHLAAVRPLALGLLDLHQAPSRSLWALVTRLAHDSKSHPILLLVHSPESQTDTGPQAWLRELALPLWQGPSDPLPHVQHVLEGMNRTGDSATARDELSAWLLAHNWTDRAAIQEVLRELEASLGDPPWDLEGKEPKDLLTPLPPAKEGLSASDRRDLLASAAQEGRAFTSRLHAEALGLDSDAVDDALDALDPQIEELRHIATLDSWRYVIRERLRFAALEADGNAQPSQRLLDLLCKDFLPGDRGLLPLAIRLANSLGDTHRAKRLMRVALQGDPPLYLEDGLALLTPLTHDAGLQKAGLVELLGHHVSGLHPDQALPRLDDLLSWAKDHHLDGAEPQLDLARGRVLSRAGRVAEALEALTRAENAFRNLNEKTGQAECKLEQAASSLQAGRPGDAAHLLDAVRGLSASPVLAARTAFLRASLARAKQDTERCAQYTEKAWELARSAEAYSLALDAAQPAAESMAAAGKLAEAATLCDQACDLARSLGRVDRQGPLLLLSAQLYAASGEPQRARSRADDALTLARNLAGDRPPQEVPALRSALYHAGVFASLTQDAQAALPLLEEAAQGARLAEDPMLEAEALLMLSQVQSKLGDPDGGAQSLTRTKELAESLPAEQSRPLRTALERLDEIRP